MNKNGNTQSNKQHEGSMALGQPFSSELLGATLRFGICIRCSTWKKRFCRDVRRSKTMGVWQSGSACGSKWYRKRVSSHVMPRHTMRKDPESNLKHNHVFHQIFLRNSCICLGFQSVVLVVAVVEYTPRPHRDSKAFVLAQRKGYFQKMLSYSLGHMMS